MKRILFALPMMALSTLVNAGVYECDMTKKSRYGWISEKIFIEFDEKARSAQVFDAYTYAYYDKKPVSAKVKRVSDKTVVIGWEMRGIRTSSGNPSGRVSYSANIDRRTGGINVNVLLLSYDNNSYGKGTCKYDAKRRF